MAVMKKSISCILAVLLIFTVWSGAAEAKIAPAPAAPRTDTLLLTDLNSGKVLFQKNSAVVRSMGSVTKLMTYILTVESVKDPENTKVKINSSLFSNLPSGASLAGLASYNGKKMSVLDLLYGLMLPSGCDASVVLANHIAGSEKNFVAQMNKRAQALGCKNTYYADSHGLSDYNKTTAEDTFRIFSHALSLPYFREIIAASYHYYECDHTVPVYQTNYLTSTTEGGMYYYPYCEGGKTGYIYSAGKCLATAAKKGETELICIALGGEYSDASNYLNNAMLDTVSLYEWAFENYTENVHVDIPADYASVELGEKLRIAYTVDKTSEGKAYKVTWTSSDPSIAVVDKNGTVTAKAPGMVKITASTKTGNLDVISVSCGFYNGMLVTSRNGDLVDGSFTDINWTSAADAGIDYAIIRSGWSWTEDADFRKNVKGAFTNGIPYGISFASYADNTAEAEKDADYVLKLLKSVSEYSNGMLLPVFYDLITDSVFLTREASLTAKIIETFRSKLRKNGYDTVIMAKKTTLSLLDGYPCAESGISVYEAWYPWIVNYSDVLTYNDGLLPYVWEYKTDGYIPGAIRDDTKHTTQTLAYTAGTYASYFDMSVTGKYDKEDVIINWTVSDSASVQPLHYNIYRDGELIASIDASQTSYTDSCVSSGKRSYSVIPVFPDPLRGAAEVPQELGSLSVFVPHNTAQPDSYNNIITFIHSVLSMFLTLLKTVR